MSDYSLFLDIIRYIVQFSQKLGRYGQQVASSQGQDLPCVPEAGSHHHGLVPMLLVIIVNLTNWQNSRIFLSFVSLVIFGLHWRCIKLHAFNWKPLPCNSPWSSQRRGRWGSPWPQHRPRPGRMRRVGWGCSECRAWTPAPLQPWYPPRWRKALLIPSPCSSFNDILRDLTAAQYSLITW